MARITNDVLVERMENVCRKMDFQYKDLKEDIGGLRKFQEANQLDIAENTKFRHQCKGVVGAVGFIAGTCGGLVIWIVSKMSR